MASRRYLNFDLLLEQEGEGRYQARVTDSPLGESPSVRFQLPFDATTLENLLLKLDPGRSGTRRVGATGQQQAAMDFGGPLYDAVFTGDLALAWQRSMDRARAEDAGGLRLRLRLKDAPAIAGLPWELLYDAKSNSFLAQSERTPVVRFLDVPQVPRPMTVDGPLRILAIISSPIDLEELDVEAEWKRINESLKPRIEAGEVVVNRLASATVGQLGDWLREHQTHVIHFVGHGDFDAQLREGVIYFQDSHGKSAPVTSSVLGPFLRDHDPLRMVVLNACRSARSDAVDPFAGMAQGLVQQDATAVVAMQFPISDRAAVTFTGEFYGALVEGFPVDQAVSSARKALLAEYRDEWSTPVLFMRSPDGNIFENVHALAAPDRPAPKPATPPPPPPGPGPLDRVLAWVRTHPGASAAAAVLVVLALVAAFVVPQLGDDGSTATDGPTSPTENPTDSPTTEAPTDEPTDEGTIDIPRSPPLSDTQMLVAAGDSEGELKIWRVDVSDPTKTRQVSTGDPKEWLPVLGPNRDTMIYSREKGQRGSGNFELRVAAVNNDANEPVLDDSDTQCAEHAGRPAWSKGSEPRDWFFVLRCRAFPPEGSTTQQPFTLQLGDMQGNLTQLDVKKQGSDDNWLKMGDPTISPDGSMVVVWVTDTVEHEAGSLYGISLEDGHSFRLLDATRPRQFSDAVFSPSLEETRIAFRAIGDNGTFDIWTAVLDGEQLAAPPEELVTSGDAFEEDPSFSPDGSTVVFTRRPTNQTTSTLLLVDVDTKSVSDFDLPEKFPPVAKVPAWTTR